MSRWITTMSAAKICLRNNDKTVMQFFVPEDDSPYYYLAMPQANIGVHDMLLDKSLKNAVLINLCVTEKLLYHAYHPTDTPSPADNPVDREQLLTDLSNQYKLQCEGELTSSSQSPTAGADSMSSAPSIPSHVQTVAQLLEYHSNLLIGVTKRIEVVGQDSKHLDGELFAL